MTTMTPPTTDLLTDEMLARFDARAATYDRENRFFDEDWDELRQSGYLLAAVPTEFGGSGLGLDEVARLQGRLAYYAPATAVAVNMHLLLDRCRRRPAAGRRRRRAVDAREGGRRRGVRRHPRRGRQRHPAAALVVEGREGRRRLGDHRPQDLRQPLAGVDLAGFHAMDTSDPEQPEDRPRLPAARHRTGYEIVETWDTLGMRATQSHDTVLDRRFVADENIVLGLPGRLRRSRPVPGRRSSPGR